MKGNIKKLAVFVMIAAIALFVAATTASAFQIRGTWAVTGFDACLAAYPPGFDPTSLTPLDGHSAISSQSWEGVYTFGPGGTGAMDVFNHDIGGSPGGGGGSLSVHWEFNYTVEPDGKITFTLVPGSYIGKWLTGTQAGQSQFLDVTDPWEGVISPDRNHMFVTWGAPLILYVLDSQGGNRVGVQLICNGSFLLFRIK